MHVLYILFLFFSWEWEKQLMFSIEQGRLRFNQGGSYYCRGLKSEHWAPRLPSHFNHCMNWVTINTNHVIMTDMHKTACLIAKKLFSFRGSAPRPHFQGLFHQQANKCSVLDSPGVFRPPTPDFAPPPRRLKICTVSTLKNEAKHFYCNVKNVNILA